MVFYLNCRFRENLNWKNDKQKALENQKILKRCFDIYHGAWNNDDQINENNHFKILQDFYETRETKNANEKTNQDDSYVNKIRKSI